MRRALLILLPWALGACAISLEPEELPRPELRTLQSEFEVIVSETMNDPEHRWESGWIGNISVNDDPEALRGLCFHWQELVFEKIAPLVHELGWDLVRVNINVGHFNEHHAVIVWNPDEIDRNRLLVVERPPAWVLDAWNSGRAEIFALREWIDGQVFVFTGPELEIAPAAVRNPAIE